MGLRRTIMLFVFYAILANLVMPTGSAWTSGRKVEQMWIKCSLDLMDFDEYSVLEYIIRDSREINRRARLLSEGSTHEAMTLMSPEIKNKFLDCLSKQNFPFHVTGEVGHRNMFTGFLESFFGWNHASRRHLADKPFEFMAPALATSFISAPALAPSTADAPSLNFGTDPPSYSPAPSLAPSPASTPESAYTAVPESTLSPSGFLPDSPPPPPSRLHPTKYSGSTNNSPVLPPKKQKSNGGSMTVAVAITAAVALLLAACLAFVCIRHQKSKNNLGYGQKDEISLLALSDLSGSSQKTENNGNTINKNGLEASPLKKNSNQDIKSSDAPSSEVLSGVSSYSTEQSTAGNAPEKKLPLPPGMVPPAQKADKPRPVPPPPPPNFKPSPQPPPPPKGGNPPRPPQARPYRPSPLGPKKSGNAASNQEAGGNSEASAPKTKLKPFFWDKVQANTDQSMVWDQLKAGSFQFNEEMIESLFGYNAIEKQKSEGKKESTSKEPSIQYVQILEPKKSQNLAISLKAMNVKTEEVCDALMEGNELPTELLQTLLRMVPTTDEELKLRLYSGDLSLLGPAEQFLKALVDIPFAFPRMDALLFMASLQEEASSTKESFSTLEVACKELRNSRLFLKLLEAVLKTGNRMNDGTFRGGAQAFKLDTLLKLSDVRGTDGKTTLLHFVVQEIIRSEGVRAARLAREGGSISSVNSDDFADDIPTDSGEYFRSLGLKVVSGLSSELENVKKAASLDADALTSTVASLGNRLVKTKEFLNTSMRNIEEDSGFHQSLKSFIEHAEAEITSLLEEEKKIRSLLKNTIEFFHGNTAKDEGLRLFVIVRDFLGMVDKACKQEAEAAKKAAKTSRGSRDALTMSPARDPRDSPSRFPVRDPRQLLFPAIKEQRMDYSSSDDED